MLGCVANFFGSGYGLREQPELSDANANEISLLN